MSSQPDIWKGWARCCVNDGIATMPSWVASVVHKDCKDPDLTWASLLALVAVETDTNAQKIAMLCMDLAWGTL